MLKIWGHFYTITKHRHMVIKHCFKAGILWQGLLHDLSKYNPVEFIVGVKYYQGDRSPNDKEREKYGYSKAWLHHKGRNKHHFEYWTDYNPKAKTITPVKIPLNYVIEMFCDRLAASKTYQKEKYTNSHPLEYFSNGNLTELMHPETYNIIKNLLIMLADKGEDETFKYIRKLNKK